MARICQSLVGKGKIEHVSFQDPQGSKYQAYTPADLAALRRAGYDRGFLDLETGLARYAAVVAASGGYHRT